MVLPADVVASILAPAAKSTRAASGWPPSGAAVRTIELVMPRAAFLIVVATSYATLGAKAVACFKFDRLVSPSLRELAKYCVEWPACSLASGELASWAVR